MSDIPWQKSSYSTQGDNDCIELGRYSGALLLRESDHPDVVSATGPLRVQALLLAVKHGTFGRLD
ncbi:DUF397 domain-containing protein [Streptomyces xiamenensis]|uniref:DUF397 domain-containing protein n=1 Tax=Streptomyces xiamenensis TaxID=408015 RepID=UPI0036C60D2F